MARAHFIYRNRPNWMLTLSSVAVLLPLTLGQSSVGGCGATIALPDSDGNTSVDSDGDGFSDDLEISSTPGTDPFDATDNPNNVRDTDGDGCSDFDELNFSGFCDSDPNTSSNAVTACNTAYYDSQFLFGFDLPSTAILEGQDTISTFLLSDEWSVNLPDGNVSFNAWVQDLPDSTAADDPSVLLGELASIVLEGLSELHDILSSGELTLSNGDTGFWIVASRTDIPVSSYQVFIVKDNLIFTVHATAIQPVSLSVDAVATETVFSLCVD